MRATVDANGVFKIGTETFRAAIGRGGIRSDKREGDGGTPSGLLPLREILFRPDRLARPACTVPVMRLSPEDGWCDDPASPAYNRQVRLPINASAEALWREDNLYDLIGVLGWNDAPIEPGRGSAIFLHVAQPDYAPTEGCVALSQRDLIRVLAMGLTEILVVGG